MYQILPNFITQAMEILYKLWKNKYSQFLNVLLSINFKYGFKSVILILVILQNLSIVSFNKLQKVFDLRLVRNKMMPEVRLSPDI